MTDPLAPPPFASPVEAALWWVRAVPVVSLAATLMNGPRPLVRWKEDGPLRTEDEVREFWAANPRAQLAIVLGPTTDGRFLGAVDTDLKNRKDGMPEPPDGFVGRYRHSTKSGGTHDLFLYKTAPPETVTRRAIGVGGFVDVLLDGLLVVPPTRFDGTKEYRVSREGEIPEFEAVGLALDQAAPWLRQTWKDHRPKAATAGRPDDKEPILEGARRATLLSRAGKLRDLGVGADAILTDLRDFNGRRCVPPLSDAEVAELARDVAKRYEPTREPEPPVATEADGPEAFEANRARVAKIVRTKDDTHGRTILIWAAHSHLIERFQSTFYLGFKGKTGAGKGTAVESCIALTPNGEVLGETTESYLASATDEGKAIGVEELDLLLERNPFIESLFRSGYRRGAYGGFKVPKKDGAKGWENARRSLFGPKVYDTHAGPSGHLLGRSILIEMEPDDSHNRALDAEWKADVLAPVRTWLEGKARRALEEWPPERFRAWWDSTEFRQRVKNLGGRGGRDHVIGALMLATCDMMGWNLDSAVAAILAGRATIEEFGVEAEVLDALRELVPTPTVGLEVLYGEVLRIVNEARKKTGVGRSLTQKSLAGPLKELGFKKGGDGSDTSDEWFRAKGGPYRDKSVLRPFRVLALFAPIPGNAAHAAHQALLYPAGNGRDGSGDSAQSLPDVNGRDGTDGRDSGSMGGEPDPADPPTSGSEARRLAREGFDQGAREEGGDQ